MTPPRLPAALPVGGSRPSRVPMLPRCVNRRPAAVKDLGLPVGLPAARAIPPRLHGRLSRTPEPRLGTGDDPGAARGRSEEHTSELQLRGHLVCRLLLEKKKK